VVPAAGGNTWHARLNQSHRVQLRAKLVEALKDCVTQKEQYSKMADIKQLAKKIEEQVHMQATKQEDYYHLLAEKVRSRFNPSNFFPLSGVYDNVVLTFPTQHRFMQIYKLKKARQQNGGAAPATGGAPPISFTPVQPNPGFPGAGGHPARPLPVAGGKMKLWKPEELKHHFIELIDELWRQPEAEAFHEPVDPVSAHPFLSGGGRGSSRNLFFPCTRTFGVTLCVRCALGLPRDPRLFRHYQETHGSADDEGKAEPW
jgi:hypothetical protein